MANLSTKKWVRYEPGLPGNRDLPDGERFFLEISSGATKTDLGRLWDGMRSLSGKSDAELATAFETACEGVVRFGSVPLTLDGNPVKTVGEYIVAVSQQAGFLFTRDLFDEVGRLNTLDEMRVVFSVRPSGGVSSTPSTNTEKGASQVVAR